MKSFLGLFIIAFFVFCKNINPNDSDDAHGDYYPHPVYPDVMLDSSAIKLSESYFIPLTDPIWYPASQSHHMRNDDYVIGIVLGTSTYAFPWWIMKNYHIANVYLDSIPVVVTLCEMCSGGAAFRASIHDQRLVFMQEGLYKGTWFMRDTQTDSYWTPFVGESFAGTLKGNQLIDIETYQTNWSTWLHLHPDTKVIYDTQEMRTGHGSFEYPGSSRMANAFEKSLHVPLSSMANPFELVIGIEVDHHPKAYPLKALDSLKSRVLNDKIQDSICVVVFHELNNTYGGGFDPVIGGNIILHFKDDGHVISDEETQSIWNLSGVCTNGKLKGSKLKPYFFTMKEKYGWINSHPNTEMYCYCR